MRAKGLELLFGRLKTAKDENEAAKIEDEIAELWYQSGRPEIDKRFMQVGDLFTENKFPAALQVLDEIVEKAPDWAEAWNTRASAHYILGQFDRSLADAERALGLEPRHFDALRTMGACHSRMGRHREALAAYRKALSIHPFLNERLDVIPELEKKLGEKPQ